MTLSVFFQLTPLYVLANILYATVGQHVVVVPELQDPLESWCSLQ